MRALSLLLCATATLFPLCATASSQTSSTGAVSGRVLDTNGAVVPGVEVELRNTATGQGLRQASGKEGRYAFPRVLPGEYALAVRGRGFRQALVAGLKVEVAKSYSLDVTLEAGDVAESVTVVAGAGLQRADATVSSVVPGESLLYLPSLERNAVEFLTLQPGTIPEAGDGDPGNRGGAIPTTDTSRIRTDVHQGVTGSNNVGTNGDPSTGGSGMNLFANPESVLGSFRRILLSRDGRSGRANPLRGFPSWNLDLSLAKTTRINEDVEARLSLDFFNVFNHTIFSNSTLDLTNPRGFGVVTQQTVPTRRESASRWIQIGLRLEF